MFCFLLRLLPEKFLIIIGIERDIINVQHTGLHGKYPLFLSDFNETCQFSRQVFEKYSDTNFMKIHPVGGEFRADGQIDEDNSRFAQFWERA